MAAAATARNTNTCIYGKIINIKSQKDNDWGRYSVELNDTRELMCVGVIPDATIGMTITLSGYEMDSKWGHQFKIQSVMKSEQDEFAGIRKFFENGYVKGIGPVKADSIIRMFGKDSLDLFDTKEGREKLLRAPGISRSLVEKAMSSYVKNRKYRPIVVFLNGMVTKNQTKKIYEKYGEKAVAELKKNPYRLQLDIDGIGFKKADRIALASGIKANSMVRLMAASVYVLDNAAQAEGHCFLTREEVAARVVSELVPAPTVKEKDITKKVVENALEDWSTGKERLTDTYFASAETIRTISQAVESRELIKQGLEEALSKAIEDELLVDDNGRIYKKQIYEIEKKAASIIRDMLSMPPVRSVSDKTILDAIKATEDRKNEENKAAGKPENFEITEEQKLAVNTALKNRISIISGGPGRGKTAISEIVAQAFMNSGFKHSSSDIIMLAPTGRAAQRITESTGYAASTAHRAIYNAKIETEKKNRKAPYNKELLPPKDKLVLCDESSMVDIFLLCEILNYAKESNIIFVGDVDQIASVGPGKCLRDMIDSGKVPTVMLRQGHRNSGTIARNSVLINSGYKLKDYEYDEHFRYIPFNTEPMDPSSKTLADLADKLAKDYEAKINEYGIRDVMLCCAMKERGDVSVNALNRRIQRDLTFGNPEITFAGGKMFRLGDRVMHTVNRKDHERMTMDGEHLYGIFNGERGIVVKVNKVPDWKKEEGNDDNIIVRFDDDTFARYTVDDISDLTLAYATTIHKCQGSEASCMMMSYTYGDYMLLNRSLFYTGETRAKKEFRFYGEEKLKYGKMLSAFDIAVGRFEDVKRNTGLKGMITERGAGCS